MDNQMFATAFLGLAHLYYAVHDLDTPVQQIADAVSDKENTDPAEEVSLYFEALQHAGPNGNGVSMSDVALSLAMRTRSITSDEPVLFVAFPESNTDGPEDVSPLHDDSPFVIVESCTDPVVLSLVVNTEGSGKRRKRADSISEDDRRPSKNIKPIDVDPIQRKDCGKSEPSCGPPSAQPVRCARALRSKSMKQALKRL